MVKKSLISIVVPIYNAEQYLQQCIDSLLIQSIDNIEIVLINDGSSDNSSMICKKYEVKDKRVLYKEIQNSGVSHARNIGIEISHGEWITFVDADDWVSPDYCEKLMRHTVEGVGLVIGRTVSVQNGKIYGDSFQWKADTNFETDKEKFILYKSVINDSPEIRKYPHIATCSAKLFRRKILEVFKIKYSESLKYYEDAIFNMEVIKNCKTIVVISDILYYYRINCDSSTQVFCENTVQYYENAALEVADFIKKQNLPMEEDYYQFNIKNMDTFLTNYFKRKENWIIQYCFVRKVCQRKIFQKAIYKVNWKMCPSRRRKVIVLGGKYGLYFLIVCIYRMARRKRFL